MWHWHKPLPAAVRSACGPIRQVGALREEGKKKTARTDIRCAPLVVTETDLPRYFLSPAVASRVARNSESEAQFGHRREFASLLPS